MSKVSTTYEAFVTRVETILSTHIELPNPYQIEQNDELALNQGWGVVWGPGQNSQRNLSCNLSVNRDIILVLTRQFITNELSHDHQESVEKLLMEDQYLMIKDIETDPKMGSTDVLKSDYLSDSGIQIISFDDPQKNNFLLLETTFQVEYLQDLNA